MLPIAAMLIRHGYGVIIPDFRGHGESEGERITFGHDEVRDVEAAYQYLLTRSEVDPERIGLLGNSMGSATALLYAAENPAVKAVVAQSPYATLEDMVQANVRRLGFPTFPLAPTMLFFIERKFGFPVDTIAPIRHIAQISPRPVLILMGAKIRGSILKAAAIVCRSRRAARIVVRPRNGPFGVSRKTCRRV